MKNVLLPLISFTSCAVATIALAMPMPYAIATKEEFIAVNKAMIEEGKTFTIPVRSYNNPWLYTLTGVGALVSFAFLVKECSDKPLINQPQAPVQQPQQVMTQPVVINNNNTVRATAVSKPQKKNTGYTPDVFDQGSNHYEWMNQLHETNCLLIYGAQGSGKTTFVKAEVEARQELGHDIIVFDPHREYGAWEGLEVTGDGMDYEAIDEALLDLQKLIKNRYLQYSQTPNFNPKPITVICEEFTQWNDKCQNSDAFFSASLSDVRKVRIHVLYVAHGDTLGNLTKKSGMGRNRDLGMMKLELIGKPDKHGKPIPSGRGKLFLPSNPNPIPVSIPDLRKQPQSQDDELDSLFDFEKNDKVIPIRRSA